MATTLSPILEAAKEILKSAGLKGMHVDDLAAAAVNANKNMGMEAEDFSRKLSGALSANLNTRKPSFARIAGSGSAKHRRGWYRVKIDKTGTVASQVVPPENTEKAFVGKAGEFAVMSELLFWGYNASVMTVDSGIDVVASKDNKYFHIQVKTSVEKDGDGRFQFSIKNSSFTAQHGSNMFYVFVLRRGLTNEYVIIPSSHLQILIAGGKISPGPMLSIQIQVDANRKKYALNGSSAVDLYVGNFGAIIV